MAKLFIILVTRSALMTALAVLLPVIFVLVLVSDRARFNNVQKIFYLIALTVQVPVGLCPDGASVLMVLVL